jgi:integrating conjugative element membrane protein (TIGR03745 family)
MNPKPVNPLTTLCKLACLTLVFAWQSALADALPTVVQPTNGAGAGDFLGTIKGYAKDAAIVLGLILALGAFLWIAYHFLYDLSEVRKGKKEMGELIMTGVAGGAVLLVVVFFANAATTVIA